MADKDKLTRGTIWVDAEAKRLCAQSMEDTDLARKSAVIEASVRPLHCRSDGEFIHVRGLSTRHSALPRGGPVPGVRLGRLSLEPKL